MSIRTIARKAWARLSDVDTSIVTFGDDSDIRIDDTPAGYYECVSCNLDPGYVAWDVDGMAEHVRAHRTNGDKVPSETIPRLLGRM